MTTEAAARLYEAQHLMEMKDKGYVVFNPHNKPIEELPVIYGFNNGGSPGWYSATLLAKVERILDELPAARDSDKALYLEFMKRHTILGTRFLFSLPEIAYAMEELISFEAISRARRRAQEKGLFVGTRRLERKEEAEGVKEWAVHG